MKNVLIIGGSYFVGRVHAILTSRGEAGRNDLHLHIVNRGRYPLNGLSNISQYVCDRHIPQKLTEVLPQGLYFDAIVDFCAYEPGDIQSIMSVLSGRFGQYIYLSTASVYAPGNISLSESAPVMDDYSSGKVDEYVRKKYELEQELIGAGSVTDIPYTILRPSFIYGPFNYAPRESWFIQQICSGNTIPIPQDASASFSFVYVMDVADIINLCIADERAYNQVFNLASPEVQTYDTFMNVLSECAEQPIKTTPVSVQQVLEQNLPLPWPLDNNLIYSGKKITDTFDYHYTPFLTGMKKTFSVFKSIYAPKA